MGLWAYPLPFASSSLLDWPLRPSMAGLGAGLGAHPSAAFEAGRFQPLAAPLRPVRSGTDTQSPPSFLCSLAYVLCLCVPIRNNT